MGEDATAAAARSKGGRGTTSSPDDEGMTTSNSSLAKRVEVRGVSTVQYILCTSCMSFMQVLVSTTL